MRRIDADELIKTFNSIKYLPNGTLVQIPNAEIDRCISFVETAPTVDDRTEEVLSLQQTIRRLQEGIEDSRPAGTWIPEEETYTDLNGTIETYTRFQCDRCMQGQNFGPYPFCPWCGSKMNPEIKEETKDEE